MRKAEKPKGAANPKLVVVFSDLHCGSDCGLLPPSVELDDGHTVGHGNNKWQQWLWASWVEANRWVKNVCGADKFRLLLNGDMIEGVHHRSDEMVAAKIIEHITIAGVCLRSLFDDATEVLAVRGTECHVRDLETVLVKSAGVAEKARDFIQFDLNGVLVDARHHMPTTSRIHLEAGALSMVATTNRANAIRARHRPARIFLRGHRHVPGIYQDGEVMVAVTGGWQGLTRHGAKVVPDSISRPSVIILDARNTESGELPILHHKCFSPPQNITVAQK